MGYSIKRLAEIQVDYMSAAGSHRVRTLQIVLRFLSATMANESLSQVLEEIRSLREEVTGIQSLREEVSSLREENKRLLELLEAKSVQPVTIRRDPESEWRVVRRGGAKGRVLPSPVMTETRNTFSVLNDECDIRDKEQADDTTLPTAKSNTKKKIVILGDSQVRGLGAEFCMRDSRKRLCVCLPGAGVDQVADRMESLLAGEGDNTTVCFSVGGNDVGRCRPEELVSRYRAALGRARDLGVTPVVCGVIPRVFAGSWWFSQAAVVNSLLADHCRTNGWLFIDNWGNFFGKDHLYARDGVHLSSRGTAALAWSLHRELGVWGFLERM